MNSSFSIKKFTLSAHITFSVAWFGAIAGFLVLAITGLISTNSQTIRSSYIAMELIGWYAIVPFCIAALITGLVQSYISPWGLFRYYWVTVKFVLTILSTIILFVHMKPISYVASVAMESTLNQFDLRKLRIQLLADAGAAMLVLLIIIALSVYKPWGKIKANKKQDSRKNMLEAAKLVKKSKPWYFYLILTLIGLVILMFIVMHLKNGGMYNHRVNITIIH